MNTSTAAEPPSPLGDVTDAPNPLPRRCRRTHPRRGFMNRFIDTIEMIAAIFVGIVAADIFISVRAALLLQLSNSRQLRFRPAAARHPDLLGHRRDLVSRHPHHRRSRLRQRRPARATRHRRVRHAGAAVRRDVPDLHAVRQGRRHRQRQRADLRSAAADLAVLPGGVARRRLGGAADRGPHLSADLPARDRWAAQYQIKPVE